MTTPRQQLIIAALGLLAAGLVACNSPTSADPIRPGDEANEPKHEVVIKTSRELGTLKARVGEEEFAGVQCSTCHSLPSQEPPASRPEGLDEFHTAMEFGHGELTCNSCHSPEDRDKLRLADGRNIAFEETMDLCGQCHGPQKRDYDMGSHGGMKGYWDLSQGGRERNNCVNCHDPHDPAFPSMHPAPPPRDRFLDSPHADEHSSSDRGDH